MKKITKTHKEIMSKTKNLKATINYINDVLPPKSRCFPLKKKRRQYQVKTLLDKNNDTEGRTLCK